MGLLKTLKFPQLLSEESPAVCKPLTLSVGQAASQAHSLRKKTGGRDQLEKQLEGFGLGV